MVDRIQRKIQSRIEPRRHAECTSLCGTCSSSRRPFFDVFPLSLKAGTSRRSLRASRSCDHHERTASASPAARIRRLLQRRPSPHSPARLASRSADGESAIFRRQDSRTSPGRRPSPSLCVARSSVIAAANYAILRIGGRRMNFDNRQVEK